MATQTTKYKIFIASPSDVIEERKIIPEIIKYWNSVNSDDFGAILEPVLWEIDATPEMGKRPQEVINKQLVEDCDILIAIFWTRLGSPTGKAESGTIEEIEKFIKDGKEVSLYFSDIPKALNSVNFEQYQKLSDIKSRYDKEGFIVNYVSISDFRKKFFMDIGRKIKSIHKEYVKVSKKMPLTTIKDGGLSKEASKLIKQDSFSPPLPTVTDVAKKESNDEKLSNTTILSRIYDEKRQTPIGSPQLPYYMWDAQNFEGFWYDLKTGNTSETLEIRSNNGKYLTKNIDHDWRVLPELALAYTTTIKTKTLKLVENGITSTEILNLFSNGQYNIIGFQFQPYVAIKGKATKLAKLIIEQGSAMSDNKNLVVGDIWDIGDGWTLSAKAIDANASPKQVWLLLCKDGVKVDDKVVSQGGIYVYTEKSLAGETNVPLFVTYVDNVFVGATSEIVQLRYTWAISKSILEIETGLEFGLMEVTTTNNDNLILKNKTPINLFPNETIDVMGNLKFNVADDNNFLRFYPIVEKK